MPCGRRPRHRPRRRDHRRRDRSPRPAHRTTATGRRASIWTDTANHDLLALIDHLVDSVDTAEVLHDEIVDAVRDSKTLTRRCRIVPGLEAERIPAYRQLLVKRALRLDG